MRKWEPNKYYISQLSSIFEEFHQNIQEHNMPQDSRRSVGYRSFVTCDDPKGVVECGTIRKYKNDSQKLKQETESRGTPGKLNTSKPEREAVAKAKGITEELHSPSTFQLLEVSRETQKLNKMIDSWSERPNFDGQSRDIAKDLLKGALDLQDSLIMLGKLQEASRYMAQLKKKHKEKSERGRNEELGSERMDSNQFGTLNYHKGFQKPRLSADGSSRNNVEELKSVIRESFSRQNLMPNMAAREKPSLVCSDDTAFPDTSKKMERPNLIAKLMGLEEFPSKPFEATSQKQWETGKKLDRKRPLFDIDVPKVRRPQSAVQKADLEQRKLKEILETMHFKGLLKCNSAKGLERSTHDMPPIVLLKPLHFPFLESKELLEPNCFLEEGASDTKKILRKLRQKEELLPLKIIHCEEGTMNSAKTRRKLEAEKKPVKSLREEGDRYCKEAIHKSEEKEAKTKRKASAKAKVDVSLDQKPQKKEMIEKKADNNRKANMPTNRRKKTSEEHMESNQASKSQDQAEVTSRQIRKPEIGTSMSKKQTSRRQSRASNSILSNSASQEIQTEKGKPIRERTAANILNEDSGCKPEEKRIDPTCENSSVLERIHPTFTDQFSLKKETDTFELQNEGICSNNACLLQEVTTLNPQQEGNIKPTEQVSHQIVPSRTKSKSSKAITNLKAFLLSNPSFLSYADEIFDLNVTQPIPLQTTDISDFEVANPRLTLDCAHELMELKSLQDSQIALTLSQTCLRNSIVCISLDLLVDEICDGVEHLRSYSKLAGENLSTDNIYTMLHSDLRCLGLVTGMWDLGWRNGFSKDEVEQVVGDIQKFVLTRLIEEILVDFSL